MTVCFVPTCPVRFAPVPPSKKFCSPKCKRFMESAMRHYVTKDIEEGRTTLEFIEQQYAEHLAVEKPLAAHTDEAKA